MMTWVSGEWKITCDRCSTEILASEAMKEWTGLIVCSDCFEERHPLDFIRARKEDLTIPFSRPEPPDTFITVNYILGNECSPEGRLCAADLGTADCMTVGYNGGMEI